MQRVERRLRRKKKVLDTDLPAILENGRVVEGPIASAYREFRAKNKEPGA